MFQVLDELPLPCGGPSAYRGLAYDGCWLYVTRACACAVDRLDRCGRLQERFQTCRCYTSLCYDPKECCFWAAGAQCPCALFKLDRCLREIDCLGLRCSGMGAVTGLSCQCCADRLLVAFAGGTALVDKEGRPVWEERSVRWTKGVLSLCPYSASWSLADGETTVTLYDRERRVVDSCRIPCGLCVEAAVLDPCECCTVYVLAVKRGCYPYLLRCALENQCVCKNLCPCNFEVCRCQPPCCEPAEACNDVLESIALMEAALSHILNAEGEKLQKAIASTDDPCRLLEINKAVNATLVNATHLEQVLFHKLEAVKEICGPCPPPACGDQAAER